MTLLPPEADGADLASAHAPATDDPLLTAARAGDADALSALIERHQGQVYRFGLRMCRDAEDASDVLQDTLLAATRSLAGFRGGASLATWLFQIARSYCIKKRRKSVFAPREELSLDAMADAGELPTAPGRDPEQQAMDSDVRRTLERAIRALDPKYREILLLRDVEGLSANEVATATGLGVPTVKTRLHRARLALRAALAPTLGPSPTESAATAGPGNCPDLPALFSRHLEGDLDPKGCAIVERHLATCPRCRHICQGLKDTLRLCQTLPAPTPPAEVAAALGVKLRQAMQGEC
jgi:RNA polymerase sigma-70 factor (ECF subfamily)